jgi:hypothetical protein
MKVYLDNNIVSGMTRCDLPLVEMGAVWCLRREEDKGMLALVTSRQSWREQARTRDAAVRKALEDSRGDVKVVHDDHCVLGFSNQADQYGGFIANPLVSDAVDETLFADLKKVIFPGLKVLKERDRSDVLHLVNAVCNHCDFFVTHDIKHFIDRRKDLESMCRGLRIVKPSELWAELSERRNLEAS